MFSDEYIETANQIVAEADRALKQLVILMAEPGSRISHTINNYQGDSGFALVGDLMKRFASTNRVVKDADQKYLMGLTFNKGDPGNVIDKMQNVFNKYPETYGTESSQIEIVRTAVNNSGKLYQTLSNTLMMDEISGNQLTLHQLRDKIIAFQLVSKVHWHAENPTRQEKRAHERTANAIQTKQQKAQKGGNPKKKVKLQFPCGLCKSDAHSAFRCPTRHKDDRVKGQKLICNECLEDHMVKDCPNKNKDTANAITISEIQEADVPQSSSDVEIEDLRNLIVANSIEDKQEDIRELMAANINEYSDYSSCPSLASTNSCPSLASSGTSTDDDTLSDLSSVSDDDIDIDFGTTSYSSGDEAKSVD